MDGRSGPRRMRVVICDEQRVFAEALSWVLSNEGYDVVACSRTPSEAAAILGQGAADACLVGLPFANVRTGRVLSTVKEAAPGVAVVALAPGSTRRVVEEAAGAGVAGMALKEDDTAEILRVLSGATQSRLSAGVKMVLAEGRPHGDHTVSPLSPRQREVLAHLANGASTGDMAAAMGVRPSTAQTHVRALLVKLGAHSRMEAVARAVHQGLVVDLPRSRIDHPC